MDEKQIQRAAKLLQFKIRDVESYIGKQDETNFIFKFTVKKTKDGIDPGSAVLFIEDMDKYFPAETIIPKSSEEMISDGVEEIMTGINDARLDQANVDSKTVNASLYDGYNRLDARDYANANSSTATTYCSHGKAQQNTVYWNTGHYPAYLYNFCHNDCADFVSQALAYGGIPKTSEWTRGYDDQSWTYAWQNCNGLKSYMCGLGYWAQVNYTNCSAGGVIMWKEGSNYTHTAMIVKNDTVTRQFSAHSYDRRKYAYSDVSGREYYTLWW